MKQLKKLLLTTLAAVIVSSFGMEMGEAANKTTKSYVLNNEEPDPLGNIVKNLSMMY